MKTTLIYSCLSSLAAVGLASPLNAVKRDVVTADQLNQFKFISQYAASPYCNSYNEPGQKIACADNKCPLVEANNVTTISGFGGVITDHRGLVAVDHTAKLIVVALRGTVSVRNWITDFITTQTPCNLTPGCLLHTGFYASWLEVSSAVFAGVKAARASNPSYRLIVTGHSLGAATATIAAGYLRKAGYAPLDLYTFGSPRVGNSAFAKFITNQRSTALGTEFRVTHDADPIARLPPIIFNFRHTSPEYWLTSGAPTTADVKLCTGHTNLKCNGGTTGFDLAPHGWYFDQINGCTPGNGETPWKGKKKREAEAKDMTDEEIEVLLNTWVLEDMKFVDELDE